IDQAQFWHIKDNRDPVVCDHREHENAAGDIDAPADSPVHGSWAHLLDAAAGRMLYAHERKAAGLRLLLRRAMTRAYVSWRGRLLGDLVLLFRLDHWGRSLQAGRTQVNRTHIVALLGDRRERTGIKPNCKPCYEDPSHAFCDGFKIGCFRHEAASHPWTGLLAF